MYAFPSLRLSNELQHILNPSLVKLTVLRLIKNMNKGCLMRPTTKTFIRLIHDESWELDGWCAERRYDKFFEIDTDHYNTAYPLNTKRTRRKHKRVDPKPCEGLSINQSINMISRQAEIKLQVQSVSYLIISVRTQNTWVITGFLFTLFSLHLVWLGSIVHKLNRHYTIYNVTNYVYQIANIAGQYYTYFCNKK